MKHWLAPILAACLTATVGCTSLHPVDIPPEDMRREIRAGHLFGPGDAIRLTTSAGERHDIVVTSVDSDAVRGETGDGGFVAIPIGEAESVELRVFSPIRTAAFGYVGVPLLTGAAVAVVLLLTAL